MTQEDGRLSTKIRKSLRDLLWSRPNKGKLINDLLTEHFKKELGNNNDKKR